MFTKHLSPLPHPPLRFLLICSFICDKTPIINRILNKTEDSKLFLNIFLSLPLSLPLSLSPSHSKRKEASVFIPKPEDKLRHSMST